MSGVYNALLYFLVMIRRFELRGITWVDLENPTADEVASTAQEFTVNPFFVEEILTPTAKPRVDVHGDAVYAIFHFPSLRHTGSREILQEVDVILSKKHLITVHYQPMEAFDDLHRTVEAESLVTKHSKKLSVGYLLFELAGRLYRYAEDELAALESTIGNVEERIFSGEEKNMVVAISKVGRELLTHKRTLGSHQETLATLEAVGSDVLGDTMRPFLKGIGSLHYRAYNRALLLADMLDELRDTNLALLSTRQNEIMKNLTIMAFVTFPLTLVAGVFGMNTVNTPLVEYPHGFYFILVLMAAITLALFAYFKLKRWL